MTGKAIYVDDQILPGMLHSATVRTPCARGRIRNISFAPEIPWDEFLIVTSQDISGQNVVALIADDQPYLVEEFFEHAEEPALLLPHPDRHLLEEALDTIKMIAYRAETSMASTVRKKLARSDDARALLRQIYNTEVDLIADFKAKTLTVRLHHLTQAAHDAAVRHLCEELTATEVTFPGTDLRLVYKLGSA